MPLDVARLLVGHGILEADDISPGVDRARCSTSSLLVEHGVSHYCFCIVGPLSAISTAPLLHRIFRSRILSP